MKVVRLSVVIHTILLIFANAFLSEVRATILHSPKRFEKKHEGTKEEAVEKYLEKLPSVLPTSRSFRGQTYSLIPGSVQVHPSKESDQHLYFRDLKEGDFAELNQATFCLIRSGDGKILCSFVFVITRKPSVGESFVQQYALYHNQSDLNWAMLSLGQPLVFHEPSSAEEEGGMPKLIPLEEEGMGVEKKSSRTRNYEFHGYRIDPESENPYFEIGVNQGQGRYDAEFGCSNDGLRKGRNGSLVIYYDNLHLRMRVGEFTFSSLKECRLVERLARLSSDLFLRLGVEVNLDKGRFLGFTVPRELELKDFALSFEKQEGETEEAQEFVSTEWGLYARCLPDGLEIYRLGSSKNSKPLPLAYFEFDEVNEHRRIWECFAETGGWGDALDVTLDLSSGKVEELRVVDLD